MIQFENTKVDTSFNRSKPLSSGGLNLLQRYYFHNHYILKDF